MIAKIKENGQVDVEAIAVNPGGWWAETYLIRDVQGSRWVVEAHGAENALEEFIESPHGTGFHIKDSEKSMYGYPQEKKDGKENSWIDLNGTIITDSKIGSRLCLASISGSGIQYDDSDLFVEELDPKDCIYFGETVPKRGLNAMQYSQWQDLDKDTKQVLMTVNLTEDPIDIASKVHDIAMNKYDNIGFENALTFVEKEYGADASVLFNLLGKAIAGLDCNSSIFVDYKDQFNKIKNKARILRDPRCHISESKNEDGSNNYSFIYYSESDYHRHSSLSECPVATQFTFERLLEEAKERAENQLNQPTENK